MEALCDKKAAPFGSRLFWFLVYGFWFGVGF
jgi:hypothetical protein